MRSCSFSRLLQLVNQQLDLDGQLEVYGHLDRCNICRDAVYELSRDLDGHLPSAARTVWQHLSYRTLSTRH